MDKGTRYEHYQDLLELFRMGKEVIAAKNKDMDDWRNFWKLDSAIEMIEAQLNRLSDYQYKKFHLKKEIDAIPKAPKEQNDKTISTEENKEALPKNPSGV